MVDLRVRAFSIIVGLIAGGLAISARSAEASPRCPLPTVDIVQLRRAMRRLRRPSRAPDRPSPWWMLAPRHVRYGFRQADSDGTGWYLGHSSGTMSERGLAGTTRGHVVGVTWDLSPLWHAAVKSRSHVDQTVALDKALARVAVYARRLAATAARAEVAASGTLDCRRHLAIAAVDAAVLEALFPRREGVIVWPSPGQRAPPIPPATSTSRSHSLRSARSSPRRARPAPPGRARRR